MQYIFKSRLYREELLRWALNIALFGWALTATILLATTKNETLVVGVSNDETYLITSDNKAHDQKELIAFIRKYLSLYYNFNEKSFSKNITAAGDLMSEELWTIKQPELEKIGANLNSDPLSQEATILSLDQLEDGKFEASLQLAIRRRLEVTKALVKVNLRLEPRVRSSQNVWPYQVAELTDAAL